MLKSHLRSRLMDHVKHAVYGERVQRCQFEVCAAFQLLRLASTRDAITYEAMLDVDFLSGYDDGVSSLSVNRLFNDLFLSHATDC
jgi:hypothetical protein